MATWRLIIEGKNSASYNMATDDFLLERAEQGGAMPTIRIYGWEVPSITIGYHQKLDRAVDISRLDGTPAVRRITGGRALFHDDNELTYAVAGNFIDHPKLGEDLHAGYRRISEAIALFYKKMLGWEADISQRDNPIGLGGKPAQQKGCLSAVSRHEIMVNGVKMAAGSQRRTKTAMIQHGAVKIAAVTFHPAIAETPPPDAEPIETIPVNRPELEHGLAAAFEDIFAVDLRSKPFSDAEKKAIRNRLDNFKNLALGLSFD